MGRGPICQHKNPVWIRTPGSCGIRDSGDPNRKVLLKKDRRTLPDANLHRPMDVRINLTFGGIEYKNISYKAATEIIFQAVTIEQHHCEKFLRIFNQKHWVVSGISSFLGNAVAPTLEQWQAPIVTLVDGLNHYQTAIMQSGDDIESRRQWKRSMYAAESCLRRSVIRYKKVHNAWHDYRHKLDSGGRTVKISLEVTIVMASAALSWGAASAFTAAGVRLLAQKAAVDAAVAASFEGAMSLSSAHHGVERFKWGGLLTKTLLAGLGSVAGNALSAKLLSSMTRNLKYAQKWIYRTPEAPGGFGGFVLKPDNWQGRAIRLDESGYQLRKYFSDFLGKGIGKSILLSAVRNVIGKKPEDKILNEKTPDRIMELITEEMLKNNLKEAFKAYLEAVVKNKLG